MDHSWDCLRGNQNSWFGKDGQPTGGRQHLHLNWSTGSPRGRTLGLKVKAMTLALSSLISVVLTVGY
ncbi:Hypothetical predicted protein [Marmota monax]|uniref:Uncharacterized protein n=1 Tax=Marmota monax TaxID=9995 RepID=A0A5E4C0M1_MARMO|nr:hypothetical protein GHT09_015745 [Marmota monax]VTJ74432.1 Hypothetical predicted protein [Marmota monax]